MHESMKKLTIIPWLADVLVCCIHRLVLTAKGHTGTYAALSIALTILLLTCSIQATVINIPDDYETINEGIAASIDGDTVLVAPGEYEEIISLQGKNILLTSSNGPNASIIAGAVLFENGEDSTCVLRGFKIVGNSGYSGVQCNNTSPIIEGNIITRHIGLACSGVSIRNSNCIIRDNIISDNHNTQYGGGIYIDGNGSIITRNLIQDNEVYQYLGYGGGIFLQGTASISYNLLINNVAVGGPAGAEGIGGGIYRASINDTLGGTTYIGNNTFVGNEAWAYGSDCGNGGGIYFFTHLDQYNDSLIIINNLYAFNYSDGAGSAARGFSNDSMYLNWNYNCIFQNNISGFESGLNDIFLDPLFADTSQHDYSLQEGSPCIDAGDPDSPLDPDSTRVDIGALFYDQSVGIDDDAQPSGPYAYALKQNYPNPFNAQTTISYELPHQANISLIVFDITGRLVKTIIADETQSSGPHWVVWDGTGNDGNPVATAIYFYRLSVDDHSIVKSMIVIK